MIEPRFLPPRAGDDDAAIVAQVEAALGLALPEPTRAGIAANVRLLERHWAILRGAE